MSEEGGIIGSLCGLYHFHLIEIECLWVLIAVAIHSSVLLLKLASLV
jgi:hypothetical protein